MESVLQELDLTSDDLIQSVRNIRWLMNRPGDFSRDRGDWERLSGYADQAKSLAEQLVKSVASIAPASWREDEKRDAAPPLSHYVRGKGSENICIDVMGADTAGIAGVTSRWNDDVLEVRLLRKEPGEEHRTQSAEPQPERADPLPNTVFTRVRTQLERCGTVINIDVAPGVNVETINESDGSVTLKVTGHDLKDIQRHLT